MEQDRWTLTVTFDSLAAQEEIDPGLTFPRDECSQLIAHLMETWAMLPEEFQEIAEWTSTKITFELSVLDHVKTVLDWVTFHAVPQSVSLTRNDSR